MGSRRYPGRRPLSGKQLTAVIGVAGALALAGCGGSSGGSSSSTAAGGGGATTSASGSATSGSIVWSASPIAGSGATDTRTVLINEFEKKYPNIHVTLTSAPTNTDTNRATLATEISGGSATPDVFMGDVIWPAQFAAHQLAVPLSDYLPQSYWSQFASGLVQGASYKGKVYGSPLFEDQGFMYYRKDLLSKAGLQPPTTWEQLESEAKTLVSKNLVKYGFVWQGASYEGLTCNYMEYLTSAGGTATNSATPRPPWTPRRRSRRLTFMRSLVTSGVYPGRGQHVPGSPVDEHLRRRQRRVPAELGLRLLQRHHPGHRQAHDQPGRRRADAGVRGPADPRLLQHRRLEHVHQPAQQEHQRRPDLHQVAGQRRRADHPGHEVLRDPHHQLGAELRRRSRP